MSEAQPDFLVRGEPLPFQELFAPLVLDARNVLHKKFTAAQTVLLRFEAHAGWERYLLKRLSGAGSKAAFCQFQAFKTVRSVFSPAATIKSRPADGFYQEFVGVSPRERLAKLFEEFPLLLKYCEVLVSNWITTVSEFLIRLEADGDSLDTYFAGGPFTSPVVRLQAGLSDPHHGGRCVVRLTFESGASLIYKPRSVATEAHFSALLEQFNAAMNPHPFKTTQCWERSEYGWMEDVITCPCDALAGVHAFYWRAGALLALVYLVRGVDMHRENLIAAGEFPVLIDLEALWHPQEHAGVTDSPLAASVMRTGFLPQNDSQMGAIYEWNALAHRLDLTFPATRWTGVNEDKMMLKFASRPFRDSQHLPVVAGTEYAARDFLPDILAGFRWVGEEVFGEHKKREKFERWTQALTLCPRRRIFRSSSCYRTMLEQLTAPPCLRKGASAAMAHSTSDNDPLTEAERRALSQLEIPWLGQAANPGDDQGELLQVRTMEEFLRQESLIVAALAPPSDEDGRLSAARQPHQG